MSHLARLLGASSRELDMAITALEHQAGHTLPSAKLTGDIHERVAAAITALGLDPSDTSGAELYGALSNRFAADFKQLVKTQKFNNSAITSLMQRRNFPKFWKDNLATGAIYDGALISFNVYDVLANFRLNAAYSKRDFTQFRKSLAAELVACYETKLGANNILVKKLKRDIISKVNS